MHRPVGLENFPIEISSFQVTLCCVQLTVKTESTLGESPNESLIISHTKDLYDKFWGNKQIKVLISICYDICWVKVSGEI